MSWFFATNIPFDPRRVPFFYGWIILVGSVLGILFSIPGQTIGISVFTDYLLDNTGLSRFMLSVAYLIGTGINFFILRFAGRLYDIYGARRTMFYVALCMSIALVSISQVDIIARWLAAFVFHIPVEPVVFACMILSFCTLRLFGQGLMTLVARNILMEWFDTYRGRVVGISSFFVSFGFSLSPLVFYTLIQMTSWRLTWLFLAGLTGLFFSLFVWVVYRDKPEDHGMTPDGRLCPEKTHSPTPSFTLREAKNTLAFWICAFTLAFKALLMTAMTFHILSIFAVAGRNESGAVSIFFPMAFVSVSTNLIVGWLSDRVHLKFLFIAKIAFMAISSGALLYLDKEGAVIILILGIGVGQGFFSVLSSIALPRYFGREHLGEISGACMAWVILFSAIGPSLFSLSYRISGNYFYGILSILIGCLMLALVAFFVPARETSSPRDPSQEAIPKNE